MELMQALVKAKLIEQSEIDRIDILTVNNNTNRNSDSATSRFLIKRDGRSLCAVKKININSPYNIEYLSQMQELIQKSNKIGAPKIYSISSAGQYIYILEEYIEGQSLEECYLQGKINKSDFMQVLNNVFIETLNSGYESTLTTTIFDEKAELESVLSELDWNKEQKLEVSRQMNELLLKSSNKPILTSGDLWPKNIIMNNNVPYLVDFDLSHITQQKWIEIVRVIHYTQHAGFDLKLSDFIDLLPKGYSENLLWIVFYLYEISLQSKILDAGMLKDVKKSLNKELYEISHSYLPDLFPAIAPDLSQEPIELSTNNSQIQFFWTSSRESEFSELNSLTADIKWDEKKVYKFEMKDNDINHLRIDPINSAGFVEIYNIVIKDEKENILHILDKQVVSFFGSAMGLEDNDIARLISFEDDPQIIFEMPDLQTNKLTLEIEMLITKDPKLLTDRYKTLLEDSYNTKVELQQAREISMKQIAVNEQMKQQHEIMQKKQQQEYVQLLNEYKTTKHELDELLNSNSWRATEFLRTGKLKLKSIKSKLMKLIYILTNYKFKIDLIPLQNIEQIDGEWKVLQNDPAITLSGKFPTGWVLMEFAGETERTLPLKMYLDFGNGMREEDTVPVGSFKKGIRNKRSYTLLLPSETKGLRLDPGEDKNNFYMSDLYFKKISSYHLTYYALKKFFKNKKLSIPIMLQLLRKTGSIIKNSGFSGLKNRILTIPDYNIDGLILDENYERWIEHYSIGEEQLIQMRNEIESFEYKPKISIIVPVYNVDEVWLRKCIDSVRAQIYNNWELCIADDASPKSHVRQVLEEYIALDSRIKVVFREKNGHISEASNSALELASGDFIGLLDNDDELTADALFQNVRLLNQYPQADMIYSDEDKITVDGQRHSPFFKPDYSPDLLLTHMYVCHFGVYRSSLVKQIGGFRKGYEGSQDFDLALRMTEVTKNVYHIPKILYHWRTIPESTASGPGAKNYTHFAGLKAINDTLTRRNIDGWVEELEGYSNFYRIHYNNTHNPLISIIIPTKDGTLLDACLNSIYKTAEDKNIEIIIIDNDSSSQDTFNVINKWKSLFGEKLKVLKQPIPFNYSTLNNNAVNIAAGELILFMNDDVEVLSANWLDDMAGQAMRNEIGAVGAFLLYPDNSVQHSGLTLGLGAQRVAGDGHHFRPLTDPGYFGSLLSVKNVSAVTAACLMIRKELFVQVDGFDEILSVAYNDVDLCIKVRELGKRNIWLPYVQMIHHESKTRGIDSINIEKVERLNEEANYMRNKWGDILLTDPYYNSNLSLDAGYVVKRI